MAADRFDHLFIAPGSYDASLRFYRETLGWRVVYEWGGGGEPRGAALSGGEVSLVIAEQHATEDHSWSHGFNGTRPTTHLSVDDLDRRYQQLAVSGTVVVAPLRRLQEQAVLRRHAQLDRVQGPEERERDSESPRELRRQAHHHPRQPRHLLPRRLLHRSPEVGLPDARGALDRRRWRERRGDHRGDQEMPRSEEHTSELQSRLHLVCRLLLEKKKKKEKVNQHYRHKVNLIRDSRPPY